MARIGILVLSFTFDRGVILITVPTKEQADQLSQLLFRTPENFLLQAIGGDWLVRINIGSNTPEAHLKHS